MSGDAKGLKEDNILRETFIMTVCRNCSPRWFDEYRWLHVNETGEGLTFIALAAGVMWNELQNDFPTARTVYMQNSLWLLRSTVS